MILRSHARSTAACMAVFVALSGCTPSGESGRNQRNTAAARVPDSASWNVRSATGRAYELQVSLPLGYEAASTRYPAVYVLDANGQFGMTSEIVRYLYLDDKLPALIVVGIGYPVGQFLNAIVPRAFDLTPDREIDVEKTIENWLSSRREYSGGRSVITGGGDKFLSVLSRELIPSVESRYRIEKTDRTLIGHSLGGLFALHTLLEQPESFTRYLVISPHVPGTDRPIYRREADRNASGWAPRARLYMTVGGNDLPGYAEGASHFAERLSSRNFPDLQWAFSVRPDESHNSVVPGAISTGLRWLHSGSRGIAEPGATR
ncbi:MAG: alpha/beta hydrolase-fold protein [Candidatus Latescibacterota bacterium]